MYGVFIHNIYLVLFEQGIDKSDVEICITLLPTWIMVVIYDKKYFE